jgi:hypothetical protein
MIFAALTDKAQLLAFASKKTYTENYIKSYKVD